MGLIAAIIGWLQYHLGLRTDAASANGSLHAKVNNIASSTIPLARDNINANVNARQKPRGVTIGNFSSSDSFNFVTALNISGTGALHMIFLYTGSNGGTVRVTMDGVVVSEGTTQTPSAGSYMWTYTNGLWASGYSPSLNAYADSTASKSLDLPFKSGLKIEVRSSNITVYWAYSKE